MFWAGIVAKKQHNHNNERALTVSAKVRIGVLSGDG
jgi:hypothetical protein